MASSKFVNELLEQLEKEYMEDNGKSRVETAADMYYFLDWSMKRLKPMDPEKPLGELVAEIKKQNTAL